MLVSLLVTLALFICIYSQAVCQIGTSHEIGLIVSLWVWLFSFVINVFVGRRVGIMHQLTWIYSYGPQFKRKQFIKRIAKFVGALIFVVLIVSAVVYFVFG